MKRFIRFMALTALTVFLVFAQDITGDWQGTLTAGSQQLRIILHFAKGNNGEWNGMLYSIDQGPDGIPITTLTLQNTNLNFQVEAVHGSYTGKLNPDGPAIDGTWTQGQPQPLTFRRPTKESTWSHDSSPHGIQFVSVEKNVKLEVLDWGGSGRPVVLLTGLGNNAHVFDKFALKLVPAYHVYGITRRGFGASSAPTPDSENYLADRLADDVLAVCDSLKLDKPVLIGHSIAGEELSSIGVRHPERTAGLIYLDAGYSYAYYDRSRGDLMIDSFELQRKLRQLQPDQGRESQQALIQELLQTALPQFEKDLQKHEKELQSVPPQPTQSVAPRMSGPTRAIFEGQERYTDIKSPVLAIYAVPHDLSQAFKDSAARAAAEAADATRTGAQATAFQNGAPSARIVRLPHANHYVFFSNEAEVLREVNAFIASLP